MNNHQYYHKIFATSQKFYHEIFILEQIQKFGATYTVQVWQVFTDLSHGTYYMYM